MCSKCKLLKDESDFSWKEKARGKRASECKDCHRLTRAIYYLNNKDKEKIQAKASKGKHKNWYKNIKKGLCCILCGESHPATLSFHHLDPTKKEFAVSQAIARGIGKERILKEIKKCSVLCENCHRKTENSGNYNAQN